MQTLSFQADEKIAKRLEKFAKKLDRSKGYIIREALLERLDDLEDYFAIKKYERNHNPEENISLEDIKKKYNLK